MTDREFWLAIRKVLLEVVDIIERRLELPTRTAEIRRMHKNIGRVVIE